MVIQEPHEIGSEVPVTKWGMVVVVTVDVCTVDGLGETGEGT